MENYNTQLCDILKGINEVINPTQNDKLTEKNTINDDLNSAINSIDTDNKTINLIIKYINNLKPTEKGKLIDTTINLIQKDGSNPIVSNVIYDNLVNLNNIIQTETDYNMSNYSKDIKTINYEQNKQFENNKFNKIYLFLFNIGLIFIILKFSYYKKTN